MTTTQQPTSPLDASEKKTLAGHLAKLRALEILRDAYSADALKQRAKAIINKLVAADGSEQDLETLGDEYLRLRFVQTSEGVESRQRVRGALKTAHKTALEPVRQLVSLGYSRLAQPYEDRANEIDEHEAEIAGDEGVDATESGTARQLRDKAKEIRARASRGAYEAGGLVLLLDEIGCADLLD